MDVDVVQAAPPPLPAENEEEEEDHMGAAEKESGARPVSASTKRNYGLVINKFRRFVNEEYPVCMDGDEVCAPLPREFVDANGQSRRGSEVILAYLEKETVRDVSAPKRKKNEDGQMQMVHKSLSHVGACAAAIHYYFRVMRRCPLDQETGSMMSAFTVDYKRKLAALRQQGDLPAVESKKPMSFEAYRMLAMSAIDPRTPRSASDHFTTVFRRLFLILSWNLMSTPETIDALLFSHITWQGDCLLVAPPKITADKKEFNDYARTVFANPLIPEICPILALAVHEICKTFRTEGAEADVFPGGKTKFPRWLQVSAERIKDDLKAIGTDSKDVTGLAIRKGALAYLGAQPGGLSAGAIHGRANLSIAPSPEKDLCMDFTFIDDARVGRAVAGLPVSEPEFATLPPHFVANSPPPEDLTLIFPNMARYPDSFLPVLPFLFASLIHHREFIRKTFPSNHPVFGSVFFQQPELAKKYAPFVETGLWMNARSKMQVTGASQHMVVESEVQRLEAMVDAIHQQQQAHMNMNAMLERQEALLGDLPELLTEKLPEICCVNKILDGLEAAGGHMAAREETEEVREAEAATHANEIKKMFHDMLEKHTPTGAVGGGSGGGAAAGVDGAGAAAAVPHFGSPPVTVPPVSVVPILPALPGVPLVTSAHDSSSHPTAPALPPAIPPVCLPSPTPAIASLPPFSNVPCLPPAITTPTNTSVHLVSVHTDDVVSSAAANANTLAADPPLPPPAVAIPPIVTSDSSTLGLAPALSAPPPSGADPDPDQSLPSPCHPLSATDVSSAAPVEPITSVSAAVTAAVSAAGAAQLLAALVHAGSGGSGESTDESGYPVYFYGGKIRHTPKDFVFPRYLCDCGQMWRLWHFGYTDPMTSKYLVRPFRLLKSAFMDDGPGKPKDCKTNLSKASLVMSVLRSAAVAENLAVSLYALDELPLQESCEVFRGAFKAMWTRMLGRPDITSDALEKQGSLSYQRTYDLICKARKAEGAEGAC